MSITVDQLSKNIQEARRQEKAHLNDALACAGAAQAYEQLLSGLVTSQRVENTLVNLENAAKSDKALAKAVKKAAKAKK